MRKIRKYIILISILTVVILTALYRFMQTRTTFNTSYVNGNTAGNLYNKGLFCEVNGYVYFSNPNDNGFLYSMKPDGSDVKLLYKDNASYINSDGRYLYYVRNNSGTRSQFSFLHINTNSLCRYDLNRGNLVILDSAPSLYASLLGNYIYYIRYDKQSASTLYRVGIDGSKKEQQDKIPYLTCATQGQYLYYSGQAEDHNLYQMDTADKKVKQIQQGSFWYPVVTGDGVYYLDPSENYSLKYLKHGSTSPRTIVSDRIDCYNIAGNTIYYQRNGDNAALCMIQTDGSGYTEIIKGNYTNINITSQSVYFSEYGQNSVIYRLPADEKGPVSIFTP